METESSSSRYLLSITRRCHMSHIHKLMIGKYHMWWFHCIQHGSTIGCWRHSPTTNHVWFSQRLQKGCQKGPGQVSWIEMQSWLDNISVKFTHSSKGSRCWWLPRSQVCSLQYHAKRNHLKGNRSSYDGSVQYQTSHWQRQMFGLHPHCFRRCPSPLQGTDQMCRQVCVCSIRSWYPSGLLKERDELLPWVTKLTSWSDSVM